MRRIAIRLEVDLLYTRCLLKVRNSEIMPATFILTSHDITRIELIIAGYNAIIARIN